MKPLMSLSFIAMILFAEVALARPRQEKPAEEPKKVEEKEKPHKTEDPEEPEKPKIRKFRPIAGERHKEYEEIEVPCKEIINKPKHEKKCKFSRDYIKIYKPLPYKPNERLDEVVPKEEPKLPAVINKNPCKCFFTAPFRFGDRLYLPGDPCPTEKVDCIPAKDADEDDETGFCSEGSISPEKVKIKSCEGKEQCAFKDDTTRPYTDKGCYKKEKKDCKTFTEVGGYYEETTCESCSYLTRVENAPIEKDGTKCEWANFCEGKSEERKIQLTVNCKWITYPKKAAEKGVDGYDPPEKGLCTCPKDDGINCNKKPDGFLACNGTCNPFFRSHLNCNMPIPIKAECHDPKRFQGKNGPQN